MLRKFFKLLRNPDSRTLDRLTREFPAQPDTERIFAMTQERLSSGEEERFTVTETRPQWRYIATVAAALVFVVGGTAAGAFLLHPPTEPETSILEAQTTAETTSSAEETARETQAAAKETTAVRMTEPAVTTAETFEPTTAEISTTAQVIVEKPAETAVTTTTAPPVQGRTTGKTPETTVETSETTAPETSSAETTPAETDPPSLTEYEAAGGRFRIICCDETYGQTVRIFGDHALSGDFSTMYLPTYLPEGYAGPALRIQARTNFGEYLPVYSSFFRTEDGKEFQLVQSQSGEDGLLIGYSNVAFSFAETAVSGQPALQIEVCHYYQNYAPNRRELLWCSGDYVFRLEALTDLPFDELLRVAESLAPEE